jgi:DNA-binding LacI/PurR family transcriptional regulator
MSKVDGIAKVILKRIRTNAYTEKIPGERALAEEFGVDFKTANRAVTALVEQGALVRRRGLGTFIAPVGQRRELSIGLCFFKMSDPGRDPVFTRFFAGMNRAIRAQGMRFDVTALSDVAAPGLLMAEQSLRFRTQVLASDPDGLIYLGNINPELIGQLRADRPTIVVDQTPDELGFDSVTRDVRSGTADAVRHLHRLGHRRIALATYQYSGPAFDLDEKELGYASAITALGLTGQLLRLGHPNEPGIVPRILACDPRPTAVVCTESTLAMQLISQGPSQGLSLPADLAIISFDDSDLGLHTLPTLSSIVAFGDELATHAVQRLLDRLDGKAVGRIKDVLPCPFIERGSSIAPAAG